MLYSLVALGVVVRAGVDADLLFQKITQKQAEAVAVGEFSAAVGGEAQVLLVQQADPTGIKNGEWVSSVREPGDGASLWLMIGEDSKQVQRLIETAEVKSSEAKKVGGIGTCSLYTPCPKCRPGFEEAVAKRMRHPIALRLQAVPAEKVRAGQYLAAIDLETKRRPLLVFEDEQAGKSLNKIRSTAIRSNRFTR